MPGTTPDPRFAKYHRQMLLWSTQIGVVAGLQAFILIWVSGHWHVFSAGFFLLVGLVCLLAGIALLVLACCLFVTGRSRARRILFAVLACLSLLVCVWLLFRGISFLEAAWTFRDYHIDPSSTTP